MTNIRYVSHIWSTKSTARSGTSQSLTMLVAFSSSIPLTSSLPRALVVSMSQGQSLMWARPLCGPESDPHPLGPGLHPWTHILTITYPARRNAICTWNHIWITDVFTTRDSTYNMRILGCEGWIVNSMHRGLEKVEAVRKSWLNYAQSRCRHATITSSFFHNGKSFVYCP